MPELIGETGRKKPYIFYCIFCNFMAYSTFYSHSDNILHPAGKHAYTVNGNGVTKVLINVHKCLLFLSNFNQNSALSMDFGKPLTSFNTKFHEILPVVVLCILKDRHDAAVALCHFLNMPNG
jgi:hypothetical protein